jgi:hypothetical protein
MGGVIVWGPSLQRDSALQCKVPILERGPSASTKCNVSSLHELSHMEHVLTRAHTLTWLEIERQVMKSARRRSFVNE